MSKRKTTLPGAVKQVWPTDTHGNVLHERGVIPARFMRCAADWLAVEEGCWYDPKAAERPVAFCKRFLCHSKGEWAGKPFELLEWQEWDVVRPLFGWRRADGTRRFRRAYIEVPKKNGKSTLCSALSLYLTIADNEPGAEVYSAAMDREQASIVYREAANMVRSSPALAHRVQIVESRKILSDPASGSFFKALSSDVPTKEGLNIHGLIFDELHAQKTRHLWDSLKYGGASRRQPLFISITTAGVDRTSICWEQHKYTEDLLAGTNLDTAFFGIIYAAGEKDDWTDPATWRKANPSFGVSLKEDQFRSDFLEAQREVGSQNSFRRYRLNQWTQQETRWLDMAQWRACPSRAPQLKGTDIPFFGGIDLASTQDIAVYVQLFYQPEFYFKWHCFIPKDRMLRRVQQDHVPYDKWAKQGWLTVTRGNTIDEDAIVETILRSGTRHKCQEIGYDPWNAPHTVTRLVDEGVKMVPVRQGFPSLNYPSKELEKLVVSGRLNHGGNPILDWMAGNVATETDAAGNIKPSKKRSFEKIDGIVAAVIALSRYLVHNRVSDSRYERQGIRQIHA